jgi:hypothetical protein
MRKERHFDLPSWVPGWCIFLPPVVNLTLGETFLESFNAGGRYNSRMTDKQTVMLSTFGVTVKTAVNTYEPGNACTSKVSEFQEATKGEKGLALIRGW